LITSTSCVLTLSVNSSFYPTYSHRRRCARMKFYYGISNLSSLRFVAACQIAERPTPRVSRLPSGHRSGSGEEASWPKGSRQTASSGFRAPSRNGRLKTCAFLHSPREPWALPLVRHPVTSLSALRAGSAFHSYTQAVSGPSAHWLQHLRLV
jgi:hypothetical protein